MIEKLVAEATECDFKVALEKKRPKSWLKSVSAFANSIGGMLFFGELSVPGTTSTISTGIANMGLQSQISGKQVPCNLSKNYT